MRITPQKASFLAYDLSRRYAADDHRRMATPLSQAKIDLNPHQIQAALFALESPFSKGVLLADEVGLGKTIEAGLLLAQRWSEGRRRLIVIGPASLTRQWADELREKFHLPTVVLTSDNAPAPPDGQVADGTAWKRDAVVICSYHFAASRIEDVRCVPWDLAIFDEAHRLRNCYKPGNKIGQSLRAAFGNTQKALLTATPFQNTLLELYGLMSIVDPHLFGSLDSFKHQFGRRRTETSLKPLADRIRPYCRRALRRDVNIRWTRRLCRREDFTSSPAEKTLYSRLTDYLTTPKLFAVPRRNRHLIAMMLRKLQASSPLALAGTLRKLVAQLETDAAEDSVRFRVDNAMDDDWDNYPILLDEWDDAEPDPSADCPEEPVAWSLGEELRVLRELISLAESIDRPCKTQALLHALTSALSATGQAGPTGPIQNKAVIFTESRRTQEYLHERLQELLPADSLVVFNGTNESARTKEIVRSWQARHAGSDLVTGNYSVDARAALVDHFRNHAVVMIATEAAAEGLNLQFCNLVINYDLPWNPQRIEQRIGRCHRYGQTRDVVVINFLDTTNAADRRVYRLLTDRIQLFNDVFGASDEILGAIGADFGFEQRVAAIYATCRTPEEINAAFDELDKAIADRIAEARASAVNTLLSSFNPSVVATFDLQLNDQRHDIRTRLLELTGFVLETHATIDSVNGVCDLRSLPPDAPAVPLGKYVTADVEQTSSHQLRWGHPLVEWIVSKGRALRPSPVEVRLDRDVGDHRSSGWIMCGSISAGGASPIEEFIGVGVADSGNTLLWSSCRKLLESDGEVIGNVEPPPNVLERLRQVFEEEVVRRCKDRLAKNLEWHRRECDKFAAWAADQEVELHKRIADVQKDVKELGQRLNDSSASSDDRVKLIRREKARRQDLAALHEQLLDTQRRVNEEQTRVLDEMLKACEVTPDTTVLFVYRWS